MVRRSESAARPLGITILCVLYAILLPVALYGLVVIFQVLPEAIVEGPTVVIVGLVIVALIYLVATYTALYGLWTLEPWGWKLAMIVFGLTALVDLVMGTFDRLIVTLLIIGYLYLKRDVYVDIRYSLSSWITGAGLKQSE